MNSKPILFRGEMVRAILEGRKTQTRRVVRVQPPSFPHDEPVKAAFCELDGKWKLLPGCSRRFKDSLFVFGKCPYGVPGDELWVRETWGIDECDRTIYRASTSSSDEHDLKHIIHAFRWRSSIFMPRRASRIKLRITDVRVERLQDISEEDAMAEGVLVVPDSTYKLGFKRIWQSIHANWDIPQWVWVVEFERAV